MTTSNETARQKDRFRVALDLVHLPAGTDSDWVHSPLTGATEVIPAAKLSLLQSCVKFDTLDQHAEALCRQLFYSPTRLPELKQTLRDFAQAGLLVSRDTLIKVFLAQSEQEPPPPITSVAIPTRNRADSLKVGLESYAHCSREYGHNVDFFIADQSDDEEQRQANLHLAAQAKAKYGCQIYYGGSEEKEALAHRLAEYTGHPFDVVNFAVSNVESCPTAYGANRNALLLSTVGSLTLQTDDDSECRLAPSPETIEQLQLTSQYSPQHLRFLSHRQTQALEDSFRGGDVLAMHEQLLGKSVAQCIEEHSSVNLDHVAGSFFTRSQPHSVFVTSLGSAGESAIGTSFWFLNRIGEERASLVRSEEVYRYAMRNHQVSRYATSMAISDGTHCGAMNLGLDNRQLLPPFTPVQRNEDGVFAELIGLGSAGYFGFLPMMILHKRPSRNYSAEDLRKYASRVDAGEMFSTFLRDFVPRPTHSNVAKNLVAIGNIFEEWGLAPRADFEQMLRSLLAGRASILIDSLKNNLDTYARQPGFWAADADMCISAFEEKMCDKEYVVAGDLRTAVGDEEARQLLQRLLRRFGQLLKIWPDLRAAAYELKMRGWQPFRQI